MKILNFGSLNLDYVYNVPRFVMPGETLSSTAMNILPGGKGLNQSIALARAGADVFHGGCYGEGGQWLVSLLKENGCDVSLLKKSDVPQGNAMIQVTPEGENSIVLYPGSNASITPAQIRETLSCFEEGDWLLMQNEIACPEVLIDLAYEKKMVIFLNPSPYNEKLAKADFRKLSWLIVNETEAFQISGEKEPERIFEYLHSQYPQISLVLTLGENGSHAWKCTNGITEHHYEPACKVTAVDTTGAGDTYTGSFVDSLSRGMPLSSCMARASLAAALCVTKPGAASSVPYASETEAFAERNGIAL